MQLMTAAVGSCWVSAIDVAPVQTCHMCASNAVTLGGGSAECAHQGNNRRACT